MRIGILGAINEEISLSREHMENVHVTSRGNRDYYSGKLHGVETVLVFSRWGKVSAASTTTTLINEFNIDCVIMTGVAGAAAAHLNNGDVIIADNLVQHDLDPRPIFKKHEIPLLGMTSIESDRDLFAITASATDNFLNSGLSKILTQETLAAFSINQPKAYSGVIASGDQFIHHPDTLKQINENIPNLLCVEMEGAAVAQVCFEYNKPFIVIRTISDKADHSAAIDFQRFIQEVACRYSHGIIEEIYKTLGK